MKSQVVERSIFKMFNKQIWKKFLKGVKDYKLIKENDKIMICISGGKDSVLLAMCIQRLQKYGLVNFTADYIVMDPGYNKENRQLIESNMKLLDLPLQVYETNIFNAVSTMGGKSPCYMCARMRRGTLYSIAKEIGYNKIALGHHFDDVIETILLSMLYGGEVRTMMPKLHSKNFHNMELIRPLYLVKEEDIVKWQKHNQLNFIDCACKLTEGEDYENDSKRKEMKQLIKHFRSVNPLIESNIFKSVENVNIDAITGYKTVTDKYSFLDNYDD